MDKFWDGLKHSSAFLFHFDEDGECVQLEETDYILYEGNEFPFIIFGDELHSLNDYCYGIVEQVEKEVERWSERKNEISKNVYDSENYELLMGIESENYKWEWISDITSSHLVILLYSFLEKTMKYLYKMFIEEGRITFECGVKRPRLYMWLYNIFGKKEEEFKAAYSDIFEILEQCRMIRNNFAHDNLEGVERESDQDYAYETRKLAPSFRLIDFISVITLVLYEVEKIYEGKGKCV